MSKRRNHDAAFKARLALGERTVSELAAEYVVYPTMIDQRIEPFCAIGSSQWRGSLLEGAAGISERGGKAAVAVEVAEETVRDLYARIMG